MNRLQAVDFAFDTRQVNSHSSLSESLPRDLETPPHQFFIPLHYEKNYAYPLLVWVHGPGGGEQEINRIMPHVSVRNYVGLGLQGVRRYDLRDEEGNPTYTWGQDAQDIASATEDLTRLLALAKQRFHIAENRVFLMGNDVGGTMALRLALSMPQAIAGAISLGGALPQTHTPLAGVDHARRLPLLFATCRDSDSYTTDDVCRDLRLLHAAGLPVAIRQYPCPQEVTTQMLADANSWMMEIVCGQSHSSCVLDDPTRLRLEEHN